MCMHICTCMLEVEKNKCQYSPYSPVGVCIGQYQQIIKYYILNFYSE